jgi:hypothetical protein
MAHKWTPEQHAKFRKTMKKLGRKKPNGDGRVHDAVIYLRHAHRAVMKDLRDGRIKELRRSDHLMSLALKELEGE